MILVNRKKYGKDKNEVIDSLFSTGGTLDGHYSHIDNKTVFYNLQGKEELTVLRVIKDGAMLSGNV